VFDGLSQRDGGRPGARRRRGKHMVANKRHIAAPAVLGCYKDKERSGDRGRYDCTTVKPLLVCGLRMCVRSRVRALGCTSAQKGEWLREEA
jgi:hypothetical protein